MDLLQEISNRLRSGSGRIWSKLSDLVYDATIGLAKQYQRKGLDLVKINLATYYVQGLKVLRKHSLLLFLFLFSAMLLAVAAVVVPVAMVLVAPWTPGIKIIGLVILGVFYVGAALVCLKDIFSEEKWMKASGFQELLDSINSDSK